MARGREAYPGHVSLLTARRVPSPSRPRCPHELVEGPRTPRGYGQPDTSLPFLARVRVDRRGRKGVFLYPAARLCCRRTRRL